MAEITVQSNAVCEIIDITAQVAAMIPGGMKNGICMLYSPHTTAGLTVNENFDPDVKHDILARLEAMAPDKAPEYRHAEGNSAAHLKTSFIGVSASVPIRNGKLALGQWQGIFFCEFDGPRPRRHIRVIFLEERD